MVKEEQQRILYRDALTAETSSVRHGKRDPIALFSQREDTGGKLMGKYHLLGSTEGPRLQWQGRPFGMLLYHFGTKPSGKTPKMQRGKLYRAQNRQDEVRFDLKGPVSSVLGDCEASQTARC